MRVDDGGVGDQVAEPAAGERERLAHGAGDDELGRVTRRAARRRWAATRTRRTPRRRSRCRGATSSSRRRSSSETLCPDGLFGLATNTTSGCVRRSRATATSTSRPKSSARLASSHSVWVPSEMIGCIEYDGTKPIALRPGPPNACSSCCRISLDPLAAQRFSTPTCDTGLRASGRRPDRCAAPPRRGRGSGAGRPRRRAPRRRRRR